MAEPAVTLAPSAGAHAAAAAPAALGVVVIGRNEGERLVRCLGSLDGVGPCVYVDSGSSDGSVAQARGAGAQVVELAVPPHFTAARARNAGIAALVEANPGLELVQTIDGDCELSPGWIAAGVAALRDDPELALVFGRLRERHPERSIYNALCDNEWDCPAGDAPGSGGIALFRLAALQAVGGYNSTMIAGEDTEMAMRLRKAGWRIRAITAEMALHDANILHFRQWWRRARRGGHGFAEMAWLHPDARWPNWPRTCRSIVAWGLVLPLATLATLLFALVWSPLWLFASLFLLAAWPLKMAQLARAKRRQGLPAPIARASGVLMMVGKFAELQGLSRFHLNRLAGRASTLIEYKQLRPR